MATSDSEPEEMKSEPLPDSTRVAAEVARLKVDEIRTSQA
jgi:hypothetical protein